MKMKKTVLAICTFSVAGCASWLGLGGADDARAFLDRFDQEARVTSVESRKAAWVQATHITDDTQWLAAKANERALTYLSEQARKARIYDAAAQDRETGRMLKLLQLSSGVPSDAKELAELTTLSAKLDAMYGAGRYCPEGAQGEDCLRLKHLEDTLRDSQNPAELLEAWKGWRTISPAMKDDYQRFVELQNTGAQDLGYDDAGAYWRAGYDMPADQFSAEVERLWSQVQPLYEALHCHVRAQLNQQYGEDIAPESGPIPAHLLGNMWAQQWGNLYSRMTPYAGISSLDVTKALEEQNYDAERMVKQAENFYQDIGFPALPDSFYRNSMLTQPRDREVVCHASAWDIDFEGDVRIKMCIVPDEDNLMTIYHELGHIYYDLAYNPLPILFQSGAHDGFHEAVGDTMMLSMTPSYLQSVGLAGSSKTNQQAVINQQLKMALDKVAFLPFGLLVDKWRWQVFSGEVGPDEYNQAWWDLKLKYQGIKPPVDRAADAFDPGAKYHIPGNTPYMRYFLAHILQFQFYKAMCDASGHEGALNECSFAGSKEAGKRLWSMLQSGQSQPWQESLFALTGTREMDAQALLEYFQPLQSWLAEQNQDRSCGW
ncbi:MAG: M2 family metallopeptidase [Oceanococcus sp.]